MLDIATNVINTKSISQLIISPYQYQPERSPINLDNIKLLPLFNENEIYDLPQQTTEITIDIIDNDNINDENNYVDDILPQIPSHQQQQHSLIISK